MNIYVNIKNYFMNHKNYVGTYLFVKLLPNIDIYCAIKKDSFSLLYFVYYK